VKFYEAETVYHNAGRVHAGDNCHGYPAGAGDVQLVRGPGVECSDELRSHDLGLHPLRIDGPRIVVGYCVGPLHVTRKLVKRSFRYYNGGTDKLLSLFVAAGR